METVLETVTWIAVLEVSLAVSVEAMHGKVRLLVACER
jgi:hypothetical protein